MIVNEGRFLWCHGNILKSFFKFSKVDCGKVCTTLIESTKLYILNTYMNDNKPVKTKNNKFTGNCISSDFK